MGKNKKNFARIAVPNGENPTEFKDMFVEEFNGKVKQGPKVKGKFVMDGATVTKVSGDLHMGKTFMAFFDQEPNKDQKDYMEPYIS